MLNCTPKVGQKKSNFWGVFIMKLTYDDKVQIYELRKQGYSLEKLSNKFGINNSNIRYMIKLIDRYGIEFVKKGKNSYYSPELKQEIIDKVLLEGRSLTVRKAETVREMVSGGFRLDLLLETARLAHSTYYYHLKQLDGVDKDQELKTEIQVIFTEHKGNYGYRRTHLEPRNRGFVVNHKKVQRLMKVLGLTARIRRKRKYSSYQGEIGKKAENLIQRQFEGAKPMEKCYTDVTKFVIPNSTQKLYLSPVLDGFNSEVIAYNLSTSPNLEQVKTMLKQAFTEKHYENTILHSDQGWQYQHDSYHRFLESKGIQPSMSRKGNSPDNGMMESFFGILKSEMFYGYEKNFRSLEDLEQAIVDYIDYYNNKRIKVKLKGLSSVQYRTKSFG